MNEPVLIHLNPIVLICIVPLFLLLYLIIRQTIDQMPLFSTGAKRVAAFCVTLLAVLGMAGGSASALLVPYGALGAAMVFMILLVCAGQSRRDPDRTVVKEEPDQDRLQRSDDRKLY